MSTIRLDSLDISPALFGQAANTSESGNFTVGIRFQFLRPCTWTGVRFYSTYAGSKTWKARAYNLTDTTALSTFTSGSLTSGLISLTFASPIAITLINKVYVASVYDTAGIVFAAMVNSNIPFLSVAGLLGPNLWLIDDSMFVAGDNQPTTGGSSERMTVEPIFSVP